MCTQRSCRRRVGGQSIWKCAACCSLSSWIYESRSIRHCGYVGEGWPEQRGFDRGGGVTAGREVGGAVRDEQAELCNLPGVESKAAAVRKPCLGESGFICVSTLRTHIDLHIQPLILLYSISLLSLPLAVSLLHQKHQ